MGFEWLKELTPEQKKEQLLEHLERLRKEIAEHSKQIDEKKKEKETAERHLLDAEQEIMLVQIRAENIEAIVTQEKAPDTLETIAREQKEERTEERQSQDYEKEDIYNRTNIYKQKAPDQPKMPEKVTDKQEYVKTEVEKIQETYTK